MVINTSNFDLTFRNIPDYVDLPLEVFDRLDNYIPNEVCHYTKMEVALEKILPQQKLIFSKFGQTNDPRESDLWHFPFGSWGPKGDFEKVEQVRDIGNKIKK